jgi:hypothetical protein
LTVLESQSLLPAGAAERYRGKWVAIRNREVVAAAASLEELYADDKVEVGDVIYRVPTSSYHYYSVA